jgi:hypothetical protein
VVVTFALCTVVPIAAHHSDSNVATDRVVTVDGELREVLFINPHVTLVVAAPGGDIYRVEWAEPRRLVRLGVTKTTLHAGDRIRVVASPSRAPGDRTLSLVREVRRAGDGWHWNRGSTVID